jgi:hypothetical protein
MANHLINKLIKNNTTLVDIYEVLEANNLSTTEFFIAVDYWINDLPLIPPDTEANKQEAIDLYIELMITLSDINFHLYNKVINEDDKRRVVGGLGNFIKIAETFSVENDAINSYKVKRKNFLYSIDYCKPAIDLLLQHLS